MDKEKFARDRRSKALLNTDIESYEAYKQSRAEFYKINNLNNEVRELKKDINDIKGLLIELLKEKNNG